MSLVVFIHHIIVDKSNKNLKYIKISHHNFFKMNVGEISFCDKVGFNINSDEVKKAILTDLENNYGIRIIARHHERFDPQKSYEVLNKHPHLICLRSNGNPYFLHLVRYNFMQYCIFIDKKIQQGYYYPRMVVFRFSFDDSLFQNGGTLLEGEMIKGKNGWYFVILDLLVNKGIHLHDQNLPKRLNTLHQLLANDFTPDETDVCKFIVKRYFNYDEKHLIQAHIMSLPYTSRGLIFRPLFLKLRDILYNFNDDLIVKVQRKKVGQFVENVPDKPVDKEHDIAIKNKITDATRQLFAQKTNFPDVYNLFDDKGVNIGTACIQGLATSKKMKELFENKNCIDKLPINCVYIERFAKWAPTF